MYKTRREADALRLYYLDFLRLTSEQNTIITRQWNIKRELMERDTAAHVSTSLTKASTETDGAINTTWAEDVAMSVWQRKNKGNTRKISSK